MRYRTLPFLLLSLMACHAWAGPNWEAIENARAEKQQQRQQAATQVEKQLSALEKLQAACAKVKQDKELTEACDEIVALHEEMLRKQESIAH